MRARPPKLPPVTFADRLLAEAVRAAEEAAGQLDPDPAALAAARAEPTPERRLIARARGLPVAADLVAQLALVRRVLSLAVLFGAGIAFLAGCGAAVAALSGGPRVNLLAVLAGLILPSTLMLLVWLAVVALTARGGPSLSLGGFVLWLARRLSVARKPSPARLAGVAALAEVAGRAPGRVAAGLVSHLVWTGFLCGALVGSAWVFIFEDVSLTCATTWLTTEQVRGVLDAVAALPQALGAGVPPAALEACLAVGRLTGPTPPELIDAKAGLAWLAFWAVLTYGLLPRLLALGATALWGWVALWRYRLDVARPAFARALALITPAASVMRIVPGEGGPPVAREADRSALPLPPSPFAPKEGPTAEPVAGAAAAPIAPAAPRGVLDLALLGLELGLDADLPWPPRVPGVRWTDLGDADGLSEVRQALARLAVRLPPPAGLVFVASLAATPDRGAAAALDLLPALPLPVWLVLTDGERARRRLAAADFAQRLADWRRLWAESGLPEGRVLEADLRHLTAAAAERLAAALGGEPDPPARPPPGLLTAAFAQIVQAAQGWPPLPDGAGRARLHAGIARLYGAAAGGQGLLGRLGLAPIADADLPKLRDAGERVRGLLPGGLRLDPRWLTAGAATGALACVAAALVAAPAALAALPLWAGGGAVVAALTGRRPPGEGAPDGPTSHEDAAVPDLGEAARPAALYALLLETQGLGEAETGRVLAAVLEPEPPPLATPAEVAEWLGGLEARARAALAAEVQG